MARLRRSRGSRDGSLVAVPQEQHHHQRQIEHRIGRKRRDCACGRDHDAADRRSKAARDVVADAVERDRRRQRFRGHLLADRGLPGRSEQRHAAADDEAEAPAGYSGVTRLSQASTVSPVAPASAIDSETSATMRRSCMSAMAPAGIAISMTGSISAVCTSATLSAEERHLRHRPGRADALDQDPEIGEQAGKPDPPEHRVPQAAPRCCRRQNASVLAVRSWSRSVGPLSIRLRSPCRDLK